MAADPLVAAQWKNRSSVDPTPKSTGANLTGVKMGVPATGVPIDGNGSFRDVLPSLPANDHTNPAKRRKKNVWNMLAVALALLFLLHLSRG